MRNRVLPIAALFSLALPLSAQADVVPSPGPRPIIRPVPAANRDPVALARRDPAIAKLLAAARGGTSQAPNAQRDETAVQVPLSGQCGFAGCSTGTLVVFSFKSRGANPGTWSVLALVTCGPTGDTCQVQPAEVRTTAQP